MMDKFCHQAAFTGQHEEDESHLLLDSPNDLKDVDEESVETKTKTVFTPVYQKRKRLSLSELKEIKGGSDEKQTQSSSKPKTRKRESTDRWSSER